ncbi:6-phosphogluconolactonase [Luteolibacter yonseiensis]|uniref:6-phosphogluconolactonase n=2 Tax=Luteolibacter yonseiensis TaxID=1144680 RepID=A0A934RBB7_9BACT|nr:6-phosphogluconolactonase [Luteolibacter yonseiensis]
MSHTARFRVFENPDSASALVAAEIAQLIRERAILGRTAVLGLPAGASPLPLYAELIYQHREEGLSFKNVVTFNLDECMGLAGSHPHSFRSFMQRHFFDHVDLPPENIRFLSGNIADPDVTAHCASYERMIKKAGGIDYQVLGIGRNGHIGFNEPGTSPVSRTHRVELSDTTREDVADRFNGLKNVPTHAVTMGCGTILKARRISLLAWGSKKSRIVRSALCGPVSSRVAASYLQNHPSAQFILDPAAASAVQQA